MDYFSVILSIARVLSIGARGNCNELSMNFPSIYSENS